MEKIEKILTDCIRDIKSGKLSLAECLDRYNTRRDELAPLIKIALNIHELPEFKLNSNSKQTMKTQLLHQIRVTRQKKPIPFTNIFSFGIPYQVKWARITSTVLVTIILMASAAGGTAYAAQDSLPGDLLYPVKEKTEDARLLIAGDESAKARLSLKFTQTRLDEMNELTSINAERAGLAIEGYKDDLDAAFQHIRQITDTSVQTNLLIQASENMQNQLAFCDSIIDNESSSSEQVNQACNLAVNQQTQFLEMLAQHNNLHAAQLNFAAMENRIQRARVEAKNNHYQIMQEVLLQYQQFNQLGKEILDNAQTSKNNDIEIELLSTQALSNYLNILDSISQQAPQQYQESIQTCRQMTSQFQIQAQNKYKEKGTPNTENIDNNNGPGTGQDENSLSPVEPVDNSNKQESDNSNSDSGNSEPGKGSGRSDNADVDPGNGAGEPDSGNNKPGNGR